ncbi:MAG: hypothetical protein U5N58_00965 [Actinomycetota bacterium]|nr:hypothetical protein [Actinomycetota bacterium]
MSLTNFDALLNYKRMIENIKETISKNYDAVIISNDSGSYQYIKDIND